ncbi:MAG: ABC transporter ATP-binding protein [Myxococcaceae bacterium]
MTLLELDAVVAAFSPAGKPVLDGLSLTVRPGEAWVVLGPNGAGKSTLVRVAMGLMTPRSGRVSRVGSSDASPAVLARDVAWVPQTIDEESGFVALDLVLMGRAPHLDAWASPSAADEQRALEVMAELEVAQVASRRVSELSGGERRRLWLARALVQQPKLLVLDEPTAFLDVKHQLDALAAVKRRLGAGLGLLAVLHDVNLASRVATHALLLKDGKALAAGPVDEVLTAAHLGALYGVAMVEHGAGAGRFFAPTLTAG